MCQKAVGGPFAALASVKLSDIAWTRSAPAVFTSSPGLPAHNAEDLVAAERLAGIESHQHPGHDPTRLTPADQIDHSLDPRKEADRAHAHTGKSETKRQATFTDKPAGQKQRMA